MCEVEDQVRTLASEFRRAVLVAGPENLMIGLRYFPKGACYETSLLLGELLRQRGLDGFHCVCGNAQLGEVFESHCWLSNNEIIIDITADQFGNGMPGVFVSRDFSWYQRWQEKTDWGPCDRTLWEGVYINDFERSFAAIVQRMNEAQN